MPRTARFPPYPRNPHQRGQARIAVRVVHYYLGPHGSPASWAEYRRLLGEWQAGRLGPRDPPPPRGARTVDDVIARFWEHALAKKYRQGDGSLRPELENYRRALRPLSQLFGPSPAASGWTTATCACSAAARPAGTSTRRPSGS